MRTGIDRETGELLQGWDHCVQSIGVILTTRIGTRVMRRAFGSEVRALQDRNPDPRTAIVVFVAMAAALRQWEPGFRLTRVTPERIGADGVAVFAIAGTFFPKGHLGDYSQAEERDACFANDNLRIWRLAP
jgi:uncharacterized protein